AKKQSAGTGSLDAARLRTTAQQTLSVSAPAPRGSEAARAAEVAKVAAAPLSDAMATQAPSAYGGKAAAPVAESKAGAVQPQAVRVAKPGSPEKQARLDEVVRKLQTATGDGRKALLLEECELEGSMGRGPDAVLTCSQVARDYPGTPEAARASEIARGFSVKLPESAPR